MWYIMCNLLRVTAALAMALQLHDGKFEHALLISAKNNYNLWQNSVTHQHLAVNCAIFLSKIR